jgi:hypothetical protein
MCEKYIKIEKECLPRATPGKPSLPLGKHDTCRQSVAFDVWLETNGHNNKSFVLPFFPDT